ncbi:SNF2 family N-terminal domain-containing protein [Aspergillus californicus]
MAAPTDPAIVEVLEDLDLHRAILESLSENRPNAVEERLETLEMIKGLETRLAQLHGYNTGRSPSRSSSSQESTPMRTLLPRTQLDGPFFSRSTTPANPPQPRQPAYTLPPQHRNPPTTRDMDMPTTRKRRYDDEYDDEEEDVGIGSSKRTAIHGPGLGFGQYALPNSPDRTPGSVGSNSEDDIEDLLDIFGIDGQDTLRELQEEQRRAEKWLDDRKVQERRDLEFARSLMDSYDSPRLSSPAIESSPTSHQQAPPFPIRAFPHSNSSMQPPPTLPNPLFANTSSAAFNTPGDFRSVFRGPQFNEVRSGLDSDDSDIAEITPRDFQFGGSFHPSHPTNDLHLNPYPPSYEYPETGFHTTSMPFHTTFPSRPAAPGPSGITNTNNSVWSQSAQAAVNHIKTAMGDPRNLYPSFDPVKQAVDGLRDFEYGSMSHHDIENLYHYGSDPKQLNDEIKQLLETIRPDADISEQDRQGTPEALKCTLLEHQKLGLAWMKFKEECDQKGGILADDMGLGKTIQAIALMVSRPSTDPDRKTTLIIAPVALMQQWKREIKKMIRPGKHELSVHVLHGDKRFIRFRDLKKYDVVLSTFGTLASEYKRATEYEKLMKSEPTLAGQYLDKMPCLGPTSKWYRVIIDEAQCIKNRNTKAALACCRLDTIYRWCMSGTPMMNTVLELHSLLQFLRISPYNSLEKFNMDFGRPLKSGSPQQREKAMTQFRVLLKAVLLRRTKESKIDGKRILSLPARILEKVHAVFDQDELSFYKALETKTQLQFNRFVESNTVGRNYSNILVLLLRLRQACCHPHLITDFGVKLNETTDGANGMDFTANAKAFSQNVIDRRKENENLECPICFDAVDNPIIFFPCGHSSCTECFSRISDPSLALRQGIDGAVEVKCPECRAIIDPKKITDNVSFHKVHFGDSSAAPAGLEGLVTASKEDEGDDTDDSDDDGLSDFIVNDSNESPARQPRSKNKGKMVQRPKKTLAVLKKEASKNIASKKKYLRRLEKTWETSAKIEKTMEIIRNIQNTAAHEKAIIFSQFTSLLDLLEVPIAREGHRYRRYDGSMKPADRNSAVLEFTDDPDCKVMLVSLKAGNSGLNLVAANHVIMFDPFWNPYIEEQAIDRAHRIGQMRQVYVHRILVPETVEDRIVELQDKKRELIDGALDEKASKGISRLSTRELGFLFGINT